MDLAAVGLGELGREKKVTIALRRLQIPIGDHRYMTSAEGEGGRITRKMTIVTKD